MNKIITLSKVFLKNSLQNIGRKRKNGKNVISKSMIIVYIIAFTYLAGIVAVVSCGMVQSLIEINQPQAFVGVVLLAIALATLIQSIFSAMSFLYYSKDNEYILPLPVKPSKIIIAKTNIIILSEYMILAIIGLIPLVVYGILNGLGVTFYIKMLMVLITFPIIPIIISSLLVLVIMSFSKLAKNKNRFQLISTIILIAVIMGMSITTSNQTQSQAEIVQLLTKANGLVEIIKTNFPTLELAIEGITSSSAISSILNIATLIAITIFIYCGYIMLGQKLYLKGVVGNFSSGKRRKKKIDERKAFKKTTLARQYIGKEIKILIRNSIFFMQCILPTLILPAMALLMFGLSLNSGEMNLGEVQTITQNVSAKTIGITIICILQFFSMFTYISVTAISRDGPSAIFMKYIPVPLMKQIDYKVVPNIILNVLVNSIIITGVAILLKLKILYIILIMIVSIMLVVLQSYLLIIIDMKKPKLEWNSEYAVVKQNINLMWPAILAFANIIAIVVFTGAIVIKNEYILIASLSIIYLVLVILVRKYIEKNVEKLFNKIY